MSLTTIVPPKLKSVLRKDIAKFAAAYNEYLKQVRLVNIKQPPNQRLKEQGCKACVSAEILLSLTMLGIFPDCQNLDEIT